MDSSTMADAVYEVEQLLDKSVIDGQAYFLVRWKGFTNDWDTWEPSENLDDCKELKDKYELTSNKKRDNSPKCSPKKSPQNSPKKGSNVAASPKSKQSPQKVGKMEKSASGGSSSPKSTPVKGTPKKAMGSGTPNKDKKETKEMGKKSSESLKVSEKGKKNISGEEKVKKKVKKKDREDGEATVKKSKQVKEVTGKELKKGKKVKITEKGSSLLKKNKGQVSAISSKIKPKSNKNGKLKVKLVDFRKKSKNGKIIKTPVKKGDSLESIIDSIVAQARKEVLTPKKSDASAKKKEKKAKLGATASKVVIKKGGVIKAHQKVRSPKKSDTGAKNKLKKEKSGNSAEKVVTKKVKLPKKRKSDEYDIIDFSTSDTDSENETLLSLSVKNKIAKTDKPSSPKKASLSTGNIGKHNTSPKAAKLAGGKNSPKISKSLLSGNKGANLTVESVKRKLEVKPIRVKPLCTSSEKSPPGSAKKKMRLIDSMHKEKAISNIVRPVSPTPVFTTFKPITTADHTALVTMATASGSLATPVEIGDVPVYHFTPHHLPISPSSMSYKSLLESLPSQAGPKKPGKKREGEESQEDERDKVERRISVRQSECAFRYKEIVVRKCQRYTQIWLNTQTKLKNCLNPQVIQEVVSALNSAKYDDSTLVMYSGLGNVFCSGIDLNFLISGDRKVVVRQMVDAIRDFTKALITFPKPIVAVVNGPAIGLGMTMLPLCDIVYASDKATFYLPYSQLSQTPEGCASFTLPQSVGMAMANELLIGGRRITAIEACNLGLVSQVFWPTSMMQEVVPKVQNIALNSAKALETTKLLVRSHQRTKLELTNESESNLLMERWMSNECQKAIEIFLNNEKNFSL